MSKKKAAKPIAGKSAGKATAGAASAKKPAAKPVSKPVVGAKSAASKVAAKKPAAPAKAVVAKPSASKPVAKAVVPPARAVAMSKSEPAKKSQGGLKKMAARAKVSEIVLPAGYVPSENEPFMNEMHRAYFRKRLLEWKDDILRQTRETLAILHEDSTQHADLADRATSETDRATELRTRDRQRKLIAKIDAALSRIEDGSYGYCEETGEPIGLKRLDARPIATLSVEAQERHERREKVYREE